MIPKIIVNERERERERKRDTEMFIAELFPIIMIVSH